MTMSSSNSGKRKSVEADGEDEIRNAEKRRKETEDDEDIIIIEDADAEEDLEITRKKWTKKYLVFLKELKGDTTKLRHLDLLDLLMDTFVSTFYKSRKSAIANLKRELDKSNRTVAALRAQNETQRRHMQSLTKVVNTLRKEIENGNCFPRPLLMQRSVGVQVSTSSTQSNTNSPEPNHEKDKEKEIRDKELERLLADLESGPFSEPLLANHLEENVTTVHFQDNWTEPRPEEREPQTTPQEMEPNETFQNDRISPEVENPASPEIDVEGFDDDDNNSMGSDSYSDSDTDTDNAPPGSPDGMPELDHQFSDSEEPTMEKIGDQENNEEETAERARPPVQHIDSDDDSDSELQEFHKEIELYKDPTVDSGLPESGLIGSGLPDSTGEDLLKGITVDELRGVLNRVLSSCELINPNDVTNDFDDVSGTNGELAVNVDVSSKPTTRDGQCDKNQNIIQAKTDSAFVNDRVAQPKPMQVDEVQTGKNNSDKTTPEPFDGCVDVGQRKSLLIEPKANKNVSPSEREKENKEPQGNKIPANINRVNTELPPPILCAVPDNLDVLLTWRMPDEVNYKHLMEFEIIYNNGNSWEQIGIYKNTGYPVMCKVGSFAAGHNYCFSVRAVAVNRQTTKYSNVCKVKI